MILADKIMCLRKQRGWSQEELANRVNVSRQSVSKWESDSSVPEMDKIVQMSSIFNVSTDYLLKDDMTEDNTVIDDEMVNITKKVAWKQEDVDSYIEHLDKYSRLTSVGVVICILGVINLILFGGMSEYHVLPLEENIAITIGLVGMFLMIALAVGIFIVTGNNHEKYSIVSRNEVYIDNRLKDHVKEIKESYQTRYNVAITTGVIFCILAVVPLIVGGIAEQNDELLISLVILMLFIISIATYLFVRVSIKYDGYKDLLSLKTLSKEANEVKEVTDQVTTIYWAIVVGIYLGWSFYTNNWGLTWIVFPVAGVLSSVVPNIISLKMRKKK